MKHRNIAFGLAAAALCAASWPAGAQSDYPVKPIRFVIGFPPGGSNNILARTLNAPGHTTNPWLIRKLNYDSLRDFAFITQIGQALTEKWGKVIKAAGIQAE